MKVHATGYIQWTGRDWRGHGTSFQVMGGWPYHADCRLSQAECAEFQALWQRLEARADAFEFAIDRFSSAFERRRPTDRLVDLMIAAESILLRDRKAGDRGELSFRLALRAAKFIQYQDYSEDDIYSIMRRAYTTRSTIVHGSPFKDDGKKNKTALPDQTGARLHEFNKTLEELVRTALRRVIDDADVGRNVRNTSYWNRLVPSDQKPSTSAGPKPTGSR